MAAKRGNGFIDYKPTMSDIKEDALAKIRDASWDVSMLEGDLSDRGFSEVALRYEAIQKKAGGVGGGAPEASAVTRCAQPFFLSLK